MFWINESCDIKKKKILSMIDVIGYLHQETIYCYIIILNVKWINFFIWRNNVLLYFWWIYKLHDLWRLVELLYIRSCNCFFKIFRNEILSDIGETIFTRNRLSRNMGCLNRNLYVMLKFTEWPKTLGRTSKKKPVLSLKGISSFAGDFVLIFMKQRLIWFNLQRDGTRDGLSNMKETFTENLQLKMSVLCNKVWAFSKAGLLSLYDGWAK